MVGDFHETSKIRLRIGRRAAGAALIVSMVLLNLGCMSESRHLVVPSGTASVSPDGDDRRDGGSASADPATRVQAEGTSSAATIDEVPSGPPVVELDGPRSEALSCGLSNPMPGGVTAGYMADTGLDLAGSPRDVFAIASGKLNYAEAGHTLWNSRRDSPYAIRLELDRPIEEGGHEITHVWYAHLSEVAREVHEGSGEVVHVRAGQRLGRSGSANGSPHLHLGMLLDGQVEQTWGTFLLEDAVRHVLCGFGKGKHLPELSSEVRPAANDGAANRRGR